MTENLLVARGEDPNCYLFQYAGSTATVVGSFLYPSITVAGVTLDKDGNLLSSANFGSIYVHSGISSTLTGSFAAAPITSSLGITVDSSNNLISLHQDGVDPALTYFHSGISSTITGSIPLLTIYDIGLTIDSNNNIYHLNGLNKYIYIHSGSSTTITGSFLAGGVNPQYLCVDGNDNIFNQSIFNAILQPEGVFFHSGATSVITGSITGMATNPYGIYYKWEATAPGTAFSQFLSESFTMGDGTRKAGSYWEMQAFSIIDYFNRIYLGSRILPGDFSIVDTVPKGIHKTLIDTRTS